MFVFEKNGEKGKKRAVDKTWYSLLKCKMLIEFSYFEE